MMEIKEAIEMAKEWKGGEALTATEKYAVQKAATVKIGKTACKLTLELYGYQDFIPDEATARKVVRAQIAQFGGKMAFVSGYAVSLANYIIEERVELEYA